MLINDEINVSTVFLVDETGNASGDISTILALKQARNIGLDLVMINDKVAKIMDYGKFLYEQKRKEKLQEKQRRENQIELKEIQLRTTTADHDLNIKAKAIKDFLKEGNHVKIFLKLKGREKMDLGRAVVEKLLSFVGTLTTYVIEKPLSSSEKNMMVVIKSE